LRDFGLRFGIGGGLLVRRRQPYSLLEEGPPPDQNIDAARPGRRCMVDEIDSLSIPRHVVLRAPVSRSNEWHAQRDGLTECQLPAWLTSHRSATKTPFKIDVEQLVSIAAPNGLAATAAGHSAPPRRARHRSNGDLRSPSLLGDVSQPLLRLRLQRGCGVRGWGRDGLGTGARGRGEGAEGVDVDYALGVMA
jgi:hypothetical protein